MKPDQLLYDLETTRQRLGGIGLTTLYEEIKAGLLETTRIGDRQFTTDSQQRAYIARKQAQGGRKAARGGGK